MNDPDQLFHANTPGSPLETFFFYDLETSGLSPSQDRIMQFAGQRTDLDLNPIGKSFNLLVKLSSDTLPSPTAVAVTKITPQATLTDGLTEAEFASFLQKDIFTPNTIAVGYNTVRFDDEFLRYLFWRNFFDPYSWQWRDGRSRWDLLDVVRLTRALRPEPIQWPVVDGKPTNRLELITKLNHISHDHAHDALSDVFATIAVARLIKTHQPELFKFLLNLRHKSAVAKIVNFDSPSPFVYASGRYSSEFNKTTVAYPLAPLDQNKALVFDLRFNLDELLDNPPRPEGQNELARFYPVVKSFSFNRCPAVAPISVLERANGWKKLQLSPELINQNLKSLKKHPDFIERLREIAGQIPDWPKPFDSESALYQGFLPESDLKHLLKIQSISLGPDPASYLADFHPSFLDSRLDSLFLHYKARNYPSALSAAEESSWERYRQERLSHQAPIFLADLKQLNQLNLDPKNQNHPPVDPFILTELELYYQSLLT